MTAVDVERSGHMRIYFESTGFDGRLDECSETEVSRRTARLLP